MQFNYAIETDPSTTKASPNRVATPLNVGILKRCVIYFPWGCAGYVGIRILHYEHQLFPTNLEEWFTGNDIEIEFELEYAIIEGWTHFKVEAYNEDDFYTHTPLVGFNVLPFGSVPTGRTGWLGA